MLKEREIVFKNQKGEFKIALPAGVRAALDTDKKELLFTLQGSGKQARSNWGTIRALAANAIAGLTKGFQKTLILEGVGFRINKEGDNLNLSLGFSHPIQYKARPGIIFEVEKNTILKIKGIDKELVGQVTAEIRSLKKPEPYKGKGFRYENEVIRRKAGKKAATAAAGA